MEYIAYIIFWILLPATVIYYRYRKRIKTGFAIGVIITSVAIGFLGAHSFEEPVEKQFIRLMNEKKYKEAEKVFAWIVQRNHEDVKNINSDLIGDPDKFDKMKRNLEKKYIDIADEIISEGKIRNIKTCDELIIGRRKINRLHHGLRMIQMAESLGFLRNNMRNQLQQNIEQSKIVVEASKDICK